MYQVGYMIGGLRFRALQEELVQTGKMTEREFHDAVMPGGPMPVEMACARLIQQPLGPEHATRWRFGGNPGRPRASHR